MEDSQKQEGKKQMFEELYKADTWDGLRNQVYGNN